MAVSVTLARTVPAGADVTALGVCSDQVDSEPGGLDWGLLRGLGFEGKAGQVQMVAGPDGRPVAVVGLGPAADVTPAVIRRSSAALARLVRRHRWLASSVLDAVADAGDLPAAAQAHAEGILLGAYGYDAFKSDPEPNSLRKLSVVGAGQEVRDALKLGTAVAEAVCFARDLVNEPGGSLTPEKLAAAAGALASGDDGSEGAALEIAVWETEEIVEAGLGGLLGVNRGSTQSPRFVEITWQPPTDSEGFLALVGKGITFDSGGLSIKPATGMETMKIDMSGAAAVLGTMRVVKTLAPPIRVTGYVPITDNMLGGDATRPGDILTIRNGKTVEVLNTDAEGRLILADALSLASEAKPDAIVDLATLTGACMVALGTKVAGLMGNHDGWIDAVEAAADRAGERVWHLPLPEDYRKQLDSPVADLKNIGNRWGGTLTAALFLQEFVADGIPWVHLDIAGPAWTDNVDGEAAKGGTGFGVRLLVDLVRNFSPPGD
ncbi:MAG: leucyl aminopeptidase [bacterium]|nr:leucyl aminopeptidase [bacterium]